MKNIDPLYIFEHGIEFFANLCNFWGFEKMTLVPQILIFDLPLHDNM